jgi:hypothetical protein
LRNEKRLLRGWIEVTKQDAGFASISKRNCTKTYSGQVAETLLGLPHGLRVVRIEHMPVSPLRP